MSSECPKSLDTSHWSVLADRCRNLLSVALAASAIHAAACNDGGLNPDGGTGPDGETSTTAPVGWGCVRVLDQNDHAMTNCTFDYDLPPEAEVKADAGAEAAMDAGAEAAMDAGAPCAEGDLYVYGKPAQLEIAAECDDLVGNVSVKIEEGNNELQKSRLNGSFCTDGYEFVADLYHQMVKLNNHLGTSTATRCANLFGETQLEKVEIVDMKLVCDNGTADGGVADGGNECVTTDGRNYLVPQGEPAHLTMRAMTGLVPPGESVTVDVILRDTNGVMQQLAVPIVIRGNEVAGGEGGTGGASGADGGMEGGADAGSDAGAQD